MARYERGYVVRRVTVLLLLALATACTEPADEERLLRSALANIEKAAEAREVRPILDYLADDFLGNQRYRKANMQGMLLLHFRQNQHIHVFLYQVDIKLADQIAHVTCQLLLAGRNEKIVPEQARILVVNSEWHKRDGQWRVVNAQWQDPLYQP